MVTRFSICAALSLAALRVAWGAQPESCGQVVTIPTHGGTTTRYALARPEGSPARDSPIALVLLVGDEGHLDLDDKGRPRALEGNSLVRSLPDFHAAGFATALVDAPSDHLGDDGLAGFRIAEQHADDLGNVIADVRARTKGPVWVVGTSRGTISAVNAASRLSGASAPDGLVLTSAVTSGGTGRYKPWAAQTVFDLRLEAIRMPVLVVGHAADKCLRSPASHMGDITDRTNGSREQVVTVTGGPGSAASGADVCEGRAPHGFIEQEAAIAAGIARFIRGGSY